MITYAATEDDKNGRQHVIGKDGYTLCGRRGSNAMGAYTRACYIEVSMRCQRPGCKGNWPDYRAPGAGVNW